MNVGDILVDPLTPSDWEPKVWVVESIERGRVNLSRVNPVNLVKTGETKREELYYAKRMRKYDGDKKLHELVRSLRHYQSETRRYVDSLSTEIDLESKGVL